MVVCDYNLQYGDYPPYILVLHDVTIPLTKIAGVCVVFLVDSSLSGMMIMTSNLNFCRPRRFWCHEPWPLFHIHSGVLTNKRCCTRTCTSISLKKSTHTQLVIKMEIVSNIQSLFCHVQYKIVKNTPCSTLTNRQYEMGYSFKWLTLR